MKTKLTAMMVMCAALTFVSSARATLVWITPVVHDCAFATDDTVRVDVMFNGTDAPIDTVGLGVTYDLARLGFIRAERGALTAAWPKFVVSDGAWIMIDAAGGPAIPATISGVFAKLVFVDKCCGLGSVQIIPLCPGFFTGHIFPVTAACSEVTCVPGSPGSLTVESIYHTCVGTDTVEVDVRVENTPQPTDAAGFDVLYNSAGLEYVGFHRGALTQAWPFFDAAKTNNIIRVGGFTSTPIPAATTGVFVTLRFVLSCCNGPGSTTSLCTQLLVDDFAPLTPGCGEVTCIPLSTRLSTWGAVKALYR